MGNYYRHLRKNAVGFTLIELSIVLVIIGIVVGSVVLGKEMIDVAKVRNQASQIEKLGTAINTFRVKYNGIAGDITNAQSLGLGDSAYHNGNGDGKIDADCLKYTYHPDHNYNKESNNFFMHLSRAGLWPGEFGGYQNETGGLMTTEQVKQRYAPAIFGNNYLFITRVQNTGFCTTIPGDLTKLRSAGNSIGIGGYEDIFTEAFPEVAVRQLDLKFDDGDPKTGNISFVHHYAATSSVWNAIGSGYTDACTTTYTCSSSSFLRPVFLERF